MTTTQINPTGITNYDIAPWAHLPEWQALSQALNAVALAANDARIDGGQGALVAAVGHLARGVGFMDCCQQCDHLPDGIDGEFHDPSTAPYATTIERGWLRGRYRCAAGHEWTCGYALNFPGMM